MKVHADQKFEQLQLVRCNCFGSNASQLVASVQLSSFLAHNLEYKLLTSKKITIMHVILAVWFWNEIWNARETGTFCAVCMNWLTLFASDK